MKKSTNCSAISSSSILLNAQNSLSKEPVPEKTTKPEIGTSHRSSKD